MLKIIQGGFHSGASAMIRKEIKELTEKKLRCFLLVPEQQTLSAEAEMAKLLPEYAPLTFEVSNFTRLANTAFRALGGVSRSYCDPVRKSLIMWKALTELSPVLSLTEGKKEISAGTVERALAADAELKSHSVDIAELLLVSEKMSKDKKRLKDKLSDIAKISSLYKKLLTEKYADAQEEEDLLCEKIQKHPDFFSEYKFYIEGFTSFTEPQYNLIGLLAKHSDVTVYLPLSKSCEDAFEYTEIKKAKEKLIRIADKNATEKKLCKIDGREGVKNHALSECVDLLWRTNSKIDNFSLQDAESLRIFEARTPYDECDFIASDIRNKVARGASYRDFAIISRRAENYVGVLDRALEEANVPYFISNKKGLNSFEAIKQIYLAYTLIIGGFKREDLIAYSKCSLCEIERDKIDEFELYTERWQISGKRFTDGILWNMNPDGYTAKKSEDCDRRLISINATRTALIDPLVRFYESERDKKTVREHAEALVSFLTDLNFEDKLAKRADELLTLGETDAADDNRKLWKTICDSLDILVEVLGDTAVDADGFSAQLKTVFSAASIGRIPSFYDVVTVGSADMIRLTDKKHIYLLGVNRTEFPMNTNESSYFTDREKSELSSLGIAIEPESEEHQARELFCFSRAFSYASESVTLLYSNSNLQFTAASPSEVIARIKEIFDGKISIKRIADIKKTELIYSAEQAMGSLGELPDEDYEITKNALVEIGFENKIDIAERRIENDKITLNKSSLDMIYKKDELALTQTRIDSYTDCPLSYFLKYNLRLSEEEQAEFDARNIGSFIHSILESFFAELHTKKKDIASLSTDEKNELIASGARNYLDLISKEEGKQNRRTEILIERLCRTVLPVVDGLCDEFKNCEYTPRYFELKIEKDNQNLPTPAEFKSSDGSRVFVYGSIDRVDTFEKDGNVFVRVVDYKTGRKDFSPSDIDEGKNLQMFLYLKSVVETKNQAFLDDIGVKAGGELIPAGVIYVKTEIGDVKIDKPSAKEALNALKSAQGRQGMLLNDATSIAAMNAQYIPVKFKKDGNPDKRSEEKLYSYAGWDSLCERMNKVVGDISQRMKKGDITATPMVKKKGETPCEYCKFKPICRNAKI